MRISDWSSDVCSSDLSRGCRPDKLPGLMDPSLIRHMPDPFVMVDMERAAKRLASAIKDNETILVFGDYDVDGATSAAILRRFLKMRSEEHTSELQSLMRISYAVFCLKKKNKQQNK